LIEILSDDGSRLIEKLVESGVEITAAAWIRTVDDGMWFLYLAMPGVKKKGSWDAYRRLNPVVRQMEEPFLVNFMEVKVIDSKDPMALASVEYQKRHGSKRVLPYRGTNLGGGTVTVSRWRVGVGGQTFVEKNSARHDPEWVLRGTIAGPGSSTGRGTLDRVVLESVADLAWAAILSALELRYVKASRGK